MHNLWSSTGRAVSTQEMIAYSSSCEIQNLPEVGTPSQSPGDACALEHQRVANLPGDETLLRSSGEVRACKPLSRGGSLGGVPSSSGSELNLAIQSQVSSLRHTSLLYWSLVKDGALPNVFLVAFESLAPFIAEGTERLQRRSAARDEVQTEITLLT